MDENNDVLEESIENSPTDEINEESVANNEDEKIDASQVEEQPKGKKSKKAKKQLTPEQKKKKRIKGLIIAAVVVLVLTTFFGSCAIVNVVGVKGLIAQAENYTQVEYTDHEQLVPYKDADGYYTFKTDRDLKVLQFTDIHIGGGCFSQSKDSWALNAVATMIRAEQPDLVIVTGDIAYPVPFQAGTFNNLNATKIFSKMMEQLGVYWTFTFGNHDTELYSMYTRESICNYYENAGFKYCLFSKGSLYDSDKYGLDNGFGNNIIKVVNTDGIITEALVTFDSHSYIDGDYFGIAWKYDNIHQEQVDWYKENMINFRSYNKLLASENNITSYVDAPVKNLVFFHIPLVEYRDAWKQVMESNVTLSNVQSKSGTITPTTINDDVVYYYGNVGESDKTKNGVRTYGVYCGSHSDELFEAGLEYAMQGVFCGHDHYNNFSISYKGIRLTYGRSIDYLAYAGIYKEHWQRGCTVITVKTDGTFDCCPTDYYLDYSATYEA